jgi:predicted nucleotidyltransferase
VDARGKVAREAAVLLYFGLEKEFRQAKVKAAENLGFHVLPSNLEVALELDRLAEETEGDARTERLGQMRRDALELMRLLEPFCPLLIGSVWRGNIRRGSDIDLEVYHDEPQEVVAQLNAQGVSVLGTERVTVTEHGKTSSSLHIHVESSGKHSAEIVVRSLDEKGRKRVCDTFGDTIRGLTICELEKLLETNPVQRFFPK